MVSTKQAAPRAKRKRGASVAKVQVESPEEWLNSHPDRRAKPLIAKPLPVVLTQSEKDKATVLTALGHGPGGECPAGLDWRNHNRPEMPNEMIGACWAAADRRSLFFNHVADEEDKDSDSFPPCGWSWCREKNRTNGSKWGEIRAAVETLKKNGIDPNSHPVVTLAEKYAHMRALAEQWPAYQPLQSFLNAKPALVGDLRGPGIGPEDLDGSNGILWLDSLEHVKWAAGVKEEGGRAKDRPLHVFLSGVKVNHHGTPASAAAILLLFGLAKGASLAKEKHRMEVAWDLTRGGDFIAEYEARTEAIRKQRVADEAERHRGFRQK